MGEYRHPRRTEFGPRIDQTRRADYLGVLQDWNARISQHHRCLRVLDAVRWDAAVEEEFFRQGAAALPRITVEDYRRSITGSGLSERLDDLRSLERDITRQIGADDAAARLLLRRCRSAQDGLRLIGARGTREFVWLSREIYGTTLGSKAHRDRINRLIGFLEINTPGEPARPHLTAEATATELQRRLGTHFAGQPIQVLVTESLNADACAGCGYLKVRRHAMFTNRDVDLLEAHEGWAHLGTMLSGRRQPVFGLLARSSPCVTSTQEGLAVLTEILAGVCHPARRQRLASRLRAVMMAEDGANFLDVYSFFRERVGNDRDAYRHAVRVFRGSLPANMGPFTKDLTYGLGLIDVLTYLRKLPDNDARAIPLLFSGKTCLDDLRDLAELHDAGLLIAGEFVPPPFRDTRLVRQGLKLLSGW